MGEENNIESRIHNPERMKQLIDYCGLSVEGYMYPTDIDGIIEYKNKKYIIFEIKYRDAKVPKGQRLALERMVNDFYAAGKKAIAFICEHEIDNPDQTVIAAQCIVREHYSKYNFFNEGKWTKEKEQLSLKEAVDYYINL